MNVLVTGGTGTVGSQVVRELVARNAAVRVLTRDRAKAANLPSGVQTVEGNLQQPKTVRSIFTNADAVFLLNAMSPTEAQEGLLAICGMRLAGVKRVVYLSVHHAETVAWLPHFGPKIAIEAGLRRSGIPFTILRPNHFFQNDYWSKDAMLQAGLYPQPIGKVGLSRVDVRDIAEAAATALLSSSHEGETYALVGPDVHTGDSTAEVWTRALGRTVRYVGDNLDTWEQQSLQYLPDWMVFDVRLMFDHFHKHGLRASDEELERVTQLLGHPPRSLEAFAQETAAMWKE